MNTDTPETESWCGWGIGGLQVVPASFARKHYRDRDELKRWTSVNGVIDLQRERDEARDERDKMQTELEMWRDGNIMHEVHRNELEKVEQERDEAKKQRDALAEALRKLADCDWVITLPDRMDAVRTIANEAIQSLTPNEL